MISYVLSLWNLVKVIYTFSGDLFRAKYVITIDRTINVTNLNKFVVEVRCEIQAIDYIYSEWRQIRRLAKFKEQKSEFMDVQDAWRKCITASTCDYDYHTLRPHETIKYCKEDIVTNNDLRIAVIVNENVVCSKLLPRKISHA